MTMGRPKQQAIMFLLGATLFGGALGFSADRVFAHRAQRGWAQRNTMYDDVGLTEKQRTSMDSLFDDNYCQTETAMKPVRPTVDSIRNHFRQQMRLLMTKEQQDRLDKRVHEDSVRRASRPPQHSPRQDVCKK
jgi:hypothetical protein